MVESHFWCGLLPLRRNRHCKAQAHDGPELQFDDQVGQQKWEFHQQKCCYMGVSINGGTSKWMVSNEKSQSKIDDLGVPLI